MTDKRCTQCGEEKPLTAFPRNRNKRDGRDPECLRCKRARESTPEARKAKRVRELERLYGLSVEDYEHMNKVQGGACRICRQPERRVNTFGERRPLAVDHDHATGAIRGLLCADCNKALGLFGDKPSRLWRAWLYLDDTAEEAKPDANPPD